MSPLITGTLWLNPRSHLFHQTKQEGQEGANFVLVICELRSVDEKWQQSINKLHHKNSNGITENLVERPSAKLRIKNVNKSKQGGTKSVVSAKVLLLFFYEFTV